MLPLASMSLNDAGNYYGTPRPVHISADSPPITYQEHRNLLRNFRTRSKSLSNLEKAAEDGDNSEDDSGLSGKYWLSALFMAACVEYKSGESSFEGKKNQAAHFRPIATRKGAFYTLRCRKEPHSTPVHGFSP